MRIFSILSEQSNKEDTDISWFKVSRKYAVYLDRSTL